MYDRKKPTQPTEMSAKTTYERLMEAVRGANEQLCLAREKRDALVEPRKRAEAREKKARHKRDAVLPSERKAAEAAWKKAEADADEAIEAEQAANEMYVAAMSAWLKMDNHRQAIEAQRNREKAQMAAEEKKWTGVMTRAWGWAL